MERGRSAPCGTIKSQMPHTLLIYAQWAGRAVAGIIAAIAFYLAFFLYEDEEGELQNRLVSLWVLVQLRSEQTNSITVAVFNKIGEILRRVFVRLFGERLLSFRAAVVSANISASGAMLFVTLVDWPTNRNRIWYLSATAFLLLAATLSVKYPRTFVLLVSCIPLSWMLIGRSLYWQMGPEFYVAGPVGVVLSIGADFLIITVLRRAFGRISEVVSAFKMLLLIVALSLLGILIEALPPILFALAGYRQLDPSASDVGLTPIFVSGVLIVASFMNLTTSLMCFIPVTMLVGLVAHKMMWPVLGRLINAFARNKIFTNRKLLVSVGTLCLTFAFNLEHVGAKELLKLLS
jgi:hypothetical protein